MFISKIGPPLEKAITSPGYEQYKWHKKIKNDNIQINNKTKKKK
jgi:hypothetical protein